MNRFIRIFFVQEIYEVVKFQLYKDSISLENFFFNIYKHLKRRGKCFFLYIWPFSLTIYIRRDFIGF